MTRRVTIVGMGRSVRDFHILAASPDSPIHQGEVWAVNLMAASIRCDRAIVMDDLDYLKGVFPASVHERWKLVPRLITSRPHPDYPNSEAYPVASILRFGVPYLNNSVAYAVALAIAEGFEEIRLYGCDFGYADHLIGPGTDMAGKVAREFVAALAGSEADRDQIIRDFAGTMRGIVGQIMQTEDGRACVEFWLGVAMSRGIAIEMSNSTTLMDSHKPRTLYGYAVQPQFEEAA